jgi:hypothetical protein
VKESNTTANNIAATCLSLSRVWKWRDKMWTARLSASFRRPGSGPSNKCCARTQIRLPACRTAAAETASHLWGTTEGKIGFHGARLQGVGRGFAFDGHEIPLPDWTAAEDWLGRWAMNLMLINVSTASSDRLFAS